MHICDVLFIMQVYRRFRELLLLYSIISLSLLLFPVMVAPPLVPIATTGHTQPPTHPHQYGTLSRPRNWNEYTLNPPEPKDFGFPDFVFVGRSHLSPSERTYHTHPVICLSSRSLYRSTPLYIYIYIYSLKFQYPHVVCFNIIFVYIVYIYTCLYTCIICLYTYIYFAISKYSCIHCNDVYTEMIYIYNI